MDIQSILNQLQVSLTTHNVVVEILYLLDQLLICTRSSLAYFSCSL